MMVLLPFQDVTIFLCWEDLFLFPQKSWGTEALKEIQCTWQNQVTHSGFHMRGVFGRSGKNIIPALITTLQLHEMTGDAKTYGLSMLLASRLSINCGPGYEVSSKLVKWE